MPNEIRVYGPPGTGKTTWLTKQINEAGTDKIIVSSFSKAAAQELVGRDLDIDKSQVGTLHSICYRAMKNPKLAEAHVDDWNTSHPSFRVASNQKAALAIDQPEMADTTREDPLAAYNLLRARGIDYCEMLLDEAGRKRAGAVTGQRTIEFIARWEEWKRANDLFDFTDLLVMAYSDFDSAPGRPEIGFFDEVQDFNPLMMEVIRKWSRNLTYSVLVGDDDQTIYTFMGASPDAFLTGVGSQERTLSHSWRLLSQVKDWSAAWVAQVSRRKDKQFTPRDQGGVVLMSGCNTHSQTLGAIGSSYRRPERLVDMISEDVASGKRVMILASCAYMLAPTIKRLRSEGIPYSNRYRPSNGSWNPFPIASEKRVPAWKRLAAFMSPIYEGRTWRLNEVLQWREPLGKRTEGCDGLFGLQATGRSLLDSVRPSEVFGGEADEEVPFYGDTGAALQWYLDAITPAKRSTYDFAGLATERGRLGEVCEPLVTVGTIHSVKGGEADSVYLFPDLSPSATRGYHTPGSEDRDAVIRLFYVGATRARDKLVLLPPDRRSTAVRWAVD